MRKQMKHLVLLFGVGVFAATSCAGDDPLVAGNEKPVAEGATTFSSGKAVQPASAPGVPGKKTSLDEFGHYYWIPGDNIFVNINGTWRQPSQTTITDEQQRADFIFPNEKLTGATYDVRYTGTDNTDMNTVTIQPIQTQGTPNYPDRLGYNGDCGTAVATRLSQGSNYSFELQHAASYLLFTPETDKYPFLPECDIEKIVVTEDNGGALAGVFDFQQGILPLAPTESPSSTVELRCGEDMGFFTYNASDAASNGAYMVIAPGNHKLTVTYYLRYIIGDTSDGIITYTRPMAVHNFKPNTVSRITHKLEIPVFNGFIFDFDSDGPAPDDRYTTFYYGKSPYYLWGARSPLWDATAWKWENTDGSSPAGMVYPNYPKENGQYLITKSKDYDNTGSNKGSKTLSPTILKVWYNQRGHFTAPTSTSYWNGVNSFSDYNNKNRAIRVINPGSPAESGWPVPLDQFFQYGFLSTASMQDVNQMTWYLQKGAPRYDADTPWLYRTSDGKWVLQHGGVWFLKASVIAQNEGTSSVGSGGSDILPSYDTYESSPLKATTCAPGISGISVSQDLRDNNWPTTYNNAALTFSYAGTGRPSDEGLDESQYFFVPFLGYVDNRRTGTSDFEKKEMKYIGQRVRFWTRTPYTKSPGDMSAFFVELNENGMLIDWRSDGETFRFKSRRFGCVAGIRPKSDWTSTTDQSKFWFR